MKIIYSKYSNIGNNTATVNTSNTIIKRMFEVLIFMAAIFATATVFAQGTSAYALKAENADMTTMTSLEVIPGSSSNQINWTISNESTPCIYVIERSTNGINFSILGKVDGIVKKEVATYSYNDKNAGSGATFYRMIKVCMNGAYGYTGIYPVNEFGNDEMQVQNAGVENEIHTDATASKPTSSVSVINNNR